MCLIVAPDFSYVVKAKQSGKTNAFAAPAPESKVDHSVLYAKVNKKSELEDAN